MTAGWEEVMSTIHARLCRPLSFLALALLLVPAMIPAIAFAADAPAPAPAGTRCFTPMVRALDLEASRPQGEPGGRVTMGPPDNPQVGDSWLWYIWRLNGFPVADLLPCTVRGMGEHCYVVVENSQWNVNIDQTAVNHIIDRFDNQSIGPHPNLGIFDINVATFGEPPDRLDEDPRIYLLYYDFDVNADGYFWPYDEFPDGSQPFSSNECEVLYLNDSDFDPAGDYMVSVVAHEFEHQIHFEYDENEAAWVDEGLGELAMWLYGRPDVISSFNSVPDNNLTQWNSTWADYIKTYLWSLYFYERYGGAPAVYDVVHEPANSITGYENVLDLHGYPANFADVFADWAVANYLDDPAVGDGRFGYVGEDLPPFNHSATHAIYPVGPVNATVNHWAADYIQFTSAASGLSFDFNGNDLTRFALWALELDAIQAPRVTRVPLTMTQDGLVQLPDIGSLYPQAVMVVAGISSAGGTNYTYSGATGVTGLAAAGAPRAVLEVLTAPNPFRGATEVRFDLPHAGPLRLQVFDAAGRLRRTLYDGHGTSGKHAFEWDGRDAARRELASGVYFLRLEAGSARAAARVVIAP
jgi:FlgD Ig-like domain